MKKAKERPPKLHESTIWKSWHNREMTVKELAAHHGYTENAIYLILDRVKAWRAANPVEEDK